MTSETVDVLYVGADPDVVGRAAARGERVHVAADVAVTAVTNADDGMAALDDAPIDCVVCDYELPETNGLAFLSTVRRHTRNVPFVLVSASDAGTLARDAFRAGVTDYVPGDVDGDRDAVLATRIFEAVSQSPPAATTPSAAATTATATADTATADTATADTATADTATADAIFTLDAADRVASVNDGFVDLFGHERDHAFGTHVSTLCDDAAALANLLDAVRSDDAPDTAQVETAFRTATHAQLRCRCRLTALPGHRDDDHVVVTAQCARDSSSSRGHFEYRSGLYDVVLDAATTLTSAEVDEIDTKIDWTLKSVGEFVDLDRCFACRFGADGDHLVATHEWTAADAALVSPTDAAWPADVTVDGDAPRLEQFPWLAVQLERFDDVRIRDREDLPDAAAALREWLAARGVRAAVFVPLVREWSLAGVVGFEVSESARPWATDEVSAARTVADLVAHTETRRRRECTLRRQNEQLEAFVSVVSHDLRNPLNVAQGFLSLAIENDDVAAARRALDATARMEALVDDLLTLARQGQTVGETVPVDVGDLADRAWRVVDTDDAVLSVTDGIGPVVADETRLREVLENLFRNAVDHGGPGVTVSVEPLRDRPGFAVADDGPGVPADERDTVFEHGHTTEVDGTGFGLAIVERIVDAHGWQIDLVESDAGGARFEIATRPASAAGADERCVSSESSTGE